MPEWHVENSELVAEYIFADFRHAMDFITSVASEAESLNHHPTWTNTYNCVSFRFSTHYAGNKITDLDIKMAQFISNAARHFIT